MFINRVFFYYRDATQTTVDSTIFDFNMSALTTLLRRQAEQNPSASYFNVDILKYQIKNKEGAGSCPFQIVAYWKCESTHTDLKVSLSLFRAKSTFERIHFIFIFLQTDRLQVQQPRNGLAEPSAKFARGGADRGWLQGPSQQTIGPMAARYQSFAMEIHRTFSAQRGQWCWIAQSEGRTRTWTRNSGNYIYTIQLRGYDTLWR